MMNSSGFVPSMLAASYAPARESSFICGIGGKYPIAVCNTGTQLPYTCPDVLHWHRRSIVKRVSRCVSACLEAELDHIALVSRDPLESAQWYHRVVGFSPIDFEEFEIGKRPFPSVRVSPGTILDFFPSPKSQETQTGMGMNHICFSVQTRVQLDEIIGRLAAAGHPLESPLPKKLSGARGTGLAVFARDYDGRRIEFRTYQ